MGLTKKEASLLQYILEKEIKFAKQAIDLTGTQKQVQYWTERKEKLQSIQEKAVATC